MESIRDCETANATAWAGVHDGDTVYIQWVYTGGPSGPPQAFVREGEVFSAEHKLVRTQGQVRQLSFLERLYSTADAAWEAAAETLREERSRWDEEIARCLKAAAASRITAGVPS
jgi:hypothetical protein